MNKKMWIVSLVIALLSLAGCSQENSNSAASTTTKQLIYGMNSEIEKINPVLDESQEIDTLLFRGLTKPNAENEVTPDLAESWKVSDDQLTYLFALRQDATWQDGEPVTARDVKFTFDQIRNPKTNTPISGEFNEIASVEVIGDYEIEMTLHRPFPPLLDKLKVGIVPEHLLQGEDLNTTEFNQNPVGNGPFKLKKWDADHTIILERNEGYYGTAPKLDEVVFKSVPDANTRILQLKTGEIDLALVEPNQLASSKKGDPYSVHEIPTADYRAVMYNFDLPLFQDKRIRQAMNYAVNRDELVKGILAGKGEAAYGPLQKSWAGTSKTEGYTYNPQKAEQLLAEAGWVKDQQGVLTKDGQRFEFELVSPIQDTVRVALANVVSEQLKPFGIVAKPKPVDQHAIKYDGEEALIIGWGSEFDPDDHTYRLFHSDEIGDGQYNFGSYQNTKVDELLLKARTTVNQDERKAYYHQFQDELTTDPPYNFLVYLQALYGVNENVSGISMRTLGHHGFGVLWNIEEWDKKVK
ncbi:peptide ABC transporter substrate-binding protein [Sporosarcina sp. P13]|uniref:ABC transporter substrate-binding protein n=1 Tax=Sporosarcina sp. P13 TaxID=2048263 RepID=UPI000C164D1E|nr:ABC transporter substrate-binding protein [Sporosarcina sp. P13]PIC63797.1 peptide ABC transporter substrate-binding protein [Sporosarcina sp. P13]